jgi:phosphoserine phosphatase
LKLRAPLKVWPSFETTVTLSLKRPFGSFLITSLGLTLVATFLPLIRTVILLAPLTRSLIRFTQPLFDENVTKSENSGASGGGSGCSGGGLGFVGGGGFGFGFGFGLVPAPSGVVKKRASMPSSLSVHAIAKSPSGCTATSGNSCPPAGSAFAVNSSVIAPPSAPKRRYGLREHEFSTLDARFVPFTAQTRMSGVELNGTRLRKGAGDAVLRWATDEGGHAPPELESELDRVARQGSTPLAVARDNQVLGVIELKDVVKEGMRERFERLRAMGIRTIMVTGDNRLTAAKIADESGVDDFLAEATPEAKLELIRRQQADGRLVAMTGDGTNDAPALAQADVGVAMNTGTQAAREAGNMVDLDSNPTKLIEIVEVGKQLLITRGALTTFSIANDVAKYFAILPAVFAFTYGVDGGRGPIDELNVMALGTPESAIVSAIVFNALIIPLLVPLALRGVRYRPVGATALLRRNLLIYGLGGLIAPFVGIKLIDLIVHNLLGA